MFEQAIPVGEAYIGKDRLLLQRICTNPNMSSYSYYRFVRSTPYSEIYKTGSHSEMTGAFINALRESLGGK